MEGFELQLQSLFEECADCPDSRLGFHGLRQLCRRLELQHCYTSLSDALLANDIEEKGVAYTDFRDALIKLLGPCSEAPRPGGGDSPAREVSPKYVFGKKKYGRRSRPDITESESNLVDGVEACSMTEESSVKKRRTEDESDFVESSVESDMPETNEEEMLVAAWSAVAPPNGRLSRDQLVQVFQGVGLQNGSDEAATSVFEKLDLRDEGITLDALLSFIKGGASLCKETRNQDFSDSIPNIDFVEAPSGLITGSHLLELWEGAGVQGGREILQSLGCRPGERYDLAMLTSRMQSLLQGVRDDHRNHLFKAGLTLQRTYIYSLKGVVEQMSGENEKLKADVSEANHRSQLLAQEVDDHHSRLEAATARRVKSLEQKHAERVRELTDQVKVEQDQLIHQNHQLEKKVVDLESGEAEARSELSRLLEENKTLQDEHQGFTSQLIALQTERDALRKTVQDLSLVQEKLQELEDMTKERDVLALMDRVSGLEGENRILRDRNDELSLQIEDLSLRLQSASIRKRSSPEPVVNLTVDAAMREIEEVCMDHEDSSMALADVNFMKDLNGPQNLISSQGPMPHANKTDTSQPKQEATQEMCSLKLKNAVLEKLSSLSPSINDDISTRIKQELAEVWTCSNLQCDCSALQETIESIRAELSKIKDEDHKCKARCQELEQSMELLQEEYERTEDYWTSKLEEERALFDSEQRQNDQKYSELVNKILEYEEMIKEEAAVKHRLEPIVENEGLEKQVMALEEEYSKLLAEKDLEIDRLQLENKSHPPVADVPVQTDNSPQNGGSDSSGHSHCRRALTFSSGDRRRSCCKVYHLQGEIRSLLETKQTAQREVAALVAERNLLYNQVLNQRREDSCSASIRSKLLCAERRCRTLMSTLRNQQLQTAELLRNTWQQHKREVEELRAVLTVTDGKLQQQTLQIQQQLSKMAAADILVKDLFVENAYLLSALRKLEAGPQQTKTFYSSP